MPKIKKEPELKEFVRKYTMRCSTTIEAYSLEDAQEKWENGDWKRDGLGEIVDWSDFKEKY